jgi:hypothetical protein
MPGLPPPIKLEKNRRKISAGRSRMTQLECTVAHMGFPAATLNKRIKKKNKKIKNSQLFYYLQNG